MDAVGATLGHNYFYTVNCTLYAQELGIMALQGHVRRTASYMSGLLNGVQFQGSSIPATVFVL